MSPSEGPNSPESHMLVAKPRGGLVEGRLSSVPPHRGSLKTHRTVLW